MTKIWIPPCPSGTQLKILLVQANSSLVQLKTINNSWGKSHTEAFSNISWRTIHSVSCPLGKWAEKVSSTWLYLLDQENETKLCCAMVPIFTRAERGNVRWSFLSTETVHGCSPSSQFYIDRSLLSLYRLRESTLYTHRTLTQWKWNASWKQPTLNFTNICISRTRKSVNKYYECFLTVNQAKQCWVIFQFLVLMYSYSTHFINPWCNIRR